MIQFYCCECEEARSVVIEPLRKDELNDVPWGDIVCSECFLVIATLSADVEGDVEIVLGPPKESSAK